MYTNSIDCWYTRIAKMKTLLSIDNFSRRAYRYKPDSIGKKISKTLKDKFAIFWKQEISRQKIDGNGMNRNKLRLYQKFKSSFSQEPYIDLVRNRNQRSWLTRMRVSAHSLHVETGRYANKPLNERICKYCPSNEIDDEYHFWLRCDTFNTKRTCLFGNLT